MRFSPQFKKPLPARRPSSKAQEDQNTFRRSRTLTGSPSSSVNSVNEGKTQLKSSRIQLNDLRSHRRRILLRLFLTVMLMIGLVGLLDQYIGYSGVKASSTGQIAKTEYKTLLDQYFSEHPFEKFRFSLNYDRLNAYVYKKAPEISGVSINDDGGLASASVSLIFRKPVVSWQIKKTTYFVDTEGQTFLVNYFEPPSVAIRDNSGLPTEDGQPLASNRLLRFIGQVVSGLNQANLKVSSVTIPSGTLKQLDITVVDRDYTIKTHMDREPAGQVANIVSALAYLDANSITPAYVDARVEGKAFYR